MHEIPPARPTDAEDVVWGLQTAASLWGRGERTDAVAWLRRAAQAASDANDDDRALELARIAAELADWVSQEGGAVPPANDTVPPVGQPAEEREETTSLDAVPNTPMPVTEDDHSPSVLPAEKVHAGMFNPWDEQPAPAAPAAPTPPKTQTAPLPPPPPAAAAPSRPAISEAPAPSPPRFEPGQDEVVTSVKPQAMPAAAMPWRAAPPRPPAVPKPPGVPSRKPPPLPSRAQKKPTPPSAPAVAVAPPAPEPEPTAPAPEPPSPPPAPAPEAPPTLDLEGVDAFADLPDDARAAFAAAAKVHVLAEGEEIAGFALAYVLEGSFDVAATMVDAPAVRLAQGAVLRSRGTTNEGVPMRIIAATSRGVIATWSDAAVETAFSNCPWVEDDLRAASDRVMTLVGITIGPLGERLDQSIREEIVGRLTVRPLIPGEIVVNKGEAVPGLLLVGVGEIELVDGDAVKGVVGSGDFLFATEVLGAGAAPQTARAGAGGALVMFGDRHIAQELMVTCPPLLEVFAGM